MPSKRLYLLANLLEHKGGELNFARLRRYRMFSEFVACKLYRLSSSPKLDQQVCKSVRKFDLETWLCFNLYIARNLFA